ncbi:MFS transporter [Bacillus sp. NEB1478]|uniref:MFS transporter n=1 Tax=Bacillus sp. NEB1478 TaxID=3073816 RepID=UPI002873C32B|nr:MFS transporter [Bacillus sp. NEB1478]WNB91372.1 MFS transporter [Bacillus sp. NEB1478]
MSQAAVLTTPSKMKSILKSRSFLFYWAIVLCSSFSIAIIQFSQSWYVVKTLDKEASLGLVFIAANVPRILFMAIGGVLADRISRTKILYVSNTLRTVLLCSLLFLLATDHLSLLSFIIFGLFFGVLDAFVWPANGSLIAAIVDNDQLTRANSIIQTTQQSSMILGPMIGGLLVASSGSYMFSFGVPAVMLFISAILAFLLNAPASESTGEKKSGMWQSIKEGIDVVKQSSFLKALFISTVFLNVFVTGPLMMGLPIFVKSILNGSALDFSYVEGSMAVGMLLSSIIIGIFNTKKRRGLMVTVSLLAMNVFFLWFSQSTSLHICMIAIFFIGITFPATNIPLISAVQSSVDKKMLGRLMGLLTMASMGLAPLSLAATSTLISYGLTIDKIMAGGAVSLIVVNLMIIWKLPALRKME